MSRDNLPVLAVPENKAYTGLAQPGRFVQWFSQAAGVFYFSRTLGLNHGTNLDLVFGL